jgi:hypothetical protein
MCIRRGRIKNTSLSVNPDGLMWFRHDGTQLGHVNNVRKQLQTSLPLIRDSPRYFQEFKPLNSSALVSPGIQVPYGEQAYLSLILCPDEVSQTCSNVVKVRVRSMICSMWNRAGLYSRQAHQAVFALKKNGGKSQAIMKAWFSVPRVTRLWLVQGRA